MAGEKLQPKPIQLRMPLAGLASWYRLGLVLIELMRKLKNRLEFDGADSLEATSEGMRMKFSAGAGGGSSSGPGVPGPWEIPEEYQTCQICPQTSVLMVRQAPFCGVARCCGDLRTDDDALPGEHAGKIVATQFCTLYENIGGTIFTSSCQRLLTLELTDGNGTATSGCSSTPDCGTGSYVESGCSDAPECVGAPGPGQKCYTLINETKAYSKTCFESNLSDAARAAAELGSFTPWTVANAGYFIGESGGRSDNTAFGIRYEFKRIKGHLPIHVIFEIRQENLGGGGIILDFEYTLTMDATTDTGFYPLVTTVPNRVNTITNVTIVYGRLP
jgi:hypothetical protein